MNDERHAEGSLADSDGVKPAPKPDLERYLRAVTIGELEHRAVEVVEYDPGWPARFAVEAGRIRAALDGRERLLEHVGSTAVPGLPAKPIVDILLAVDDPADEASYVPALAAAGYVLRIREPGWHEHRMLRTPAKDVHVHVFAPADEEVERMLLFRDRLRADAGDGDAYAGVKRRLAQQDWPTMQHYAEAKGELVEAIIARARGRRGRAGR